MRNIQINRPKRFVVALVTMIVNVDGKKAAKLKNGAQITLQVDENQHELRVHGGVFNGKAFSWTLTIPAGTLDYAFQVDLLENQQGETGPVLRPCGAEPLSDKVTGVVSHLGTTLTRELLGGETRAVMAGMPGARLTLNLEETGWDLVLRQGEERKTVLEAQPYFNMSGALIIQVNASLNRAGLKTPEGREEILNTVFREYLAYLPGYRVVGENELEMVG